MKKALFIHGFLGDGDSSTGFCVKEALKDRYDFICPNFKLENANETLDEIRRLIKDENIELLTATSLGSFYAIAVNFPGQMLIVNPCMKPSEEIPGLPGGNLVPESSLSLWKNLEEEIYPKNKSNRVQGFFASKDELFDTKYHELFENCFGKGSIVVFEGGHHGMNEKLTQSVAENFKEL